MSKKILNQRGMSLVEVMVAAGISGVIALGTMKINENAQKGMRNIQTKAGRTNYINMKMSSMLAGSDTCPNSFDVDADGNPGDNVDVAESGTINGIGGIYYNDTDSGTVIPLAVVGENLEGTNGDYRVSGLSFERTTSTSCTLTIDLDRVDAGTNKVGGRNARETLSMGCAFTPLTHATPDRMTNCSSRGAAEMGQWSYNPGPPEYLQNEFGNAVLGVPAGTPRARFSIVDGGVADPYGNRAWETQGDGIAIPDNFVIRWGDPDAEDGIAIFASDSSGDECITFKAVGQTEHLTACQSNGTTIRNQLRVGGNFTVPNGTSGFGGNVSVNADINATGNISGNTLTSTNNGTIGGSLTVNGDGIFNSNLTVNNPGTLTAATADIDTIRGPTNVISGQLSTSAGFVPDEIIANGDGDVDVTGNLSITGSARTGGDMEVNGNLIASNIAGSTTVASDIYTNGSGYFQNIFVSQNANVTGDVTANAFVYSSDRRLKENIHSLKDGTIEDLLSLNPVSFNWIDKQSRGDKTHLGFIAQEVEKVYPDLVYDNGINKGVNYGGLIAPIIQSIKEVYASIVGIDRKISSLEAENKKLLEENKQIKERLSLLEAKINSNDK